MQHYVNQAESIAPAAYTVNNIGIPTIDHKVNRINFRFFYIGEDQEMIHHLSKVFQSGWTADNFQEAKRHIIDADPYNQQIPDVIFIDKTVVRSEVIAFHQFLKDEQLFVSTLVIYHSLRLKKDDLAFLQHYQLADDVLDIKSEKIDYQKKILFLKRIKRSEGRQIKAAASIQTPVPDDKTFSSVCKRLLDIFISLIAILILLPLMVLIAIILKLESKGPVLYISKRAGRGFNVFDFYKFRSMVVDADKKVETLIRHNQYSGSNGALFFKVANDPRITRFGKFLRNTSLDELPQLFNVLKGDMSLVGNRPLPIYEAITLTTNEFVERFAAPAGITGLWQIKKRGNAEMSIEERISLDISYSRNHGLLSDLKIMAHTPMALFQKTTV